MEQYYLLYERLGAICKAEGNRKMAREYYEKFLEISKQLAEKTGTRDILRNLAIAYVNLGEILEAEGDSKTAREYYDKFREIAFKVYGIGG